MARFQQADTFVGLLELRLPEPQLTGEVPVLLLQLLHQAEQPQLGLG